MEKLIFRESYPLWLLFLLGYGVIWAYMVVVNFQRGKPVEQRDLFDFHKGKRMQIAGMLPVAVLFIFSVFMEVQPGDLTWLGLLFFSAGIIINIVALYSFSHSEDGINTSGIYRISRNPMYVGGFFFFAGLNLMAWEQELINYGFLIFTLVWMGATHWIVLREEQFLRHKYGADFENYKSNVRRYL